jgi:hypothetical protein
VAVAEKVNNRWVNRRALRRYQHFRAALDAAGEALAVARVVAAKADDSRRISWSVPRPEDLRAAVAKAGRSLEILAKAGTKWEAELISREWTR